MIQQGDRMAFLPACVVSDEIRGDGVNPGGEGTRGIVTAAFLIHADEGFLQKVCCGGRVRAATMQIGQEAWAPAAHECIQGWVVSAGESDHELGIFLLQVGCNHAAWWDVGGGERLRVGLLAGYWTLLRSSALSDSSSGGCVTSGRMSERNRRPCSGVMSAETSRRWPIMLFRQRSQIAFSR